MYKGIEKRKKEGYVWAKKSLAHFHYDRRRRRKNLSFYSQDP
jgi:hypothetical protein